MVIFLKWQKFFFSTVFVLISIPLITGILSLEAQTKLYGVKKTEKPNFTWRGFFSNEYQSEFTRYYEKGFANYAIAQKMYNQLFFYAFQKSTCPLIVITDGNNLVHTNSTEEFLHRENELALDNAIADYVDIIASISRKAKELGKSFVFLISPSKVNFVQDAKNKRLNDVKAYHLKTYNKLIKALAEKDVFVIDSYSLFKEYETRSTNEKPFPLFVKSGVHWTLSSTSLPGKMLYDHVAEKSTLPALEIAEYYQTNNCEYVEELDGWNLLNIWSPVQSTFVYPKILTVHNENSAKLDVFMQGGSYSWAFIHFLNQIEMTNQSDVLFYNAFVRDMRTGARSALDPKNLNYNLPQITRKIVDSDLIIIEMQQAAIEWQLLTVSKFGAWKDWSLSSHKFAVWLDSFLGSLRYLVELDAISLQNFNNLESRHVWMKAGTGTIQVKDTTERHVKKSMVLTIPWSEFARQPNQTLDSDYPVKILVDGELIATLLPESKPKSYEIRLPDSRIHEIKIDSPYYFIPSATQGTSDNRALSVALSEIRGIGHGI